jgi:hypothetical protein
MNKVWLFNFEKKLLQLSYRKAYQANPTTRKRGMLLFGELKYIEKLCY